MTSRERVAAALEGGKPDCIPIFPVYDYGYMMASIGRDAREFITASASQRIRLIEESFLRHDVDGMHVYSGATDEWVNKHTVEKFDDYWMVTENETGGKYRLLPDCSTAREDGTRVPHASSVYGVSRIQTMGDIDKHLSPPPTEHAINASGRYAPLRYLREKYPDHHFTRQIDTPMVRALRTCGGLAFGWGAVET